MGWAKGGVPGQNNSSYPADHGTPNGRRPHVDRHAQLRGGRDVHVLLWPPQRTADQAPTSATYYSDSSGPRAMPTGPVMVDAKALQGRPGGRGQGGAVRHLASTPAKANSKPVRPRARRDGRSCCGSRRSGLHRQAHRQPGQPRANLQLSQQRAQAVVAALASTTRSTPSACQARGVVNLAPLAQRQRHADRARATDGWN